MKVFILSFLLIIFSIKASEHGIYFQLIKNSTGTVQEVADQCIESLKSNSFEILAVRNLSTPDLVRTDLKEHCGYNAKLIVFTSRDYLKFITSYGNKYLVAGFLKAVVYNDPQGVCVAITDPETINRIVFNDMYENDNEKDYKAVYTKTKSFKTKIISAAHSLKTGEKIQLMKAPIRDDEDLMESSKDMMMMVGPMTFFNDEDQFQLIYSEKNNDRNAIKAIMKQINKNLENFKPDKEDLEYRHTESPAVLKWEIISRVSSPDSSALLLGLTRQRTEALSFHIAGKSRESKDNKCPGIDHGAAYPIEVLILHENDVLKIYTARQMFRMDMYFWDAGMMAFMDHMSMPGILDKSLRRALLADKYKD